MNKTIYIRQEDIEIWNSIKDKPRFIHDALRSVSPVKYNKATEERKEIEKILKPHLKVMSNKVDGVAFCKHNAVKGFCKKGCK